MLDRVIAGSPQDQAGQEFRVALTLANVRMFRHQIGRRLSDEVWYSGPAVARYVVGRLGLSRSGDSRQ